MEENISDPLKLRIPQDSQAATKYILGKLVTEIHPIIIEVRHKIQAITEDADDTSKISEVYLLCLSQITKCLLNLFDVFRLEYSHCTVLQESRQCNLDRLLWCVNRLISISKYIERHFQSHQDNESADNSLSITTMYFVNWIDHAFENLNKLSKVVYKTDHKEMEGLYEIWKNEMVECISGLYISVDELLLCAMTLCRYCLPSDQYIVKARCQVVLRETKELLGELIHGDVSSTIVATPDTLKLPVMPANVNVAIDVLKDVLYVLETNTNTALLGLLIHCFSNNMSPVDVLKAHFMDGCTCVDCSMDAAEECANVKEFDLYNERLLQIGSFAVSCSSDQNRILALQSGLASLEALDPHLVPALMMSPESCHANWLIKSWRQEVQEIRDSVFLIVDPAAFSDKSKQMMHQKLKDVLKEGSYDNAMVSSVINFGCVILDFFNVYIKIEPDGLGVQREILLPLLLDLEKVTSECKIVSNLLCSGTDFTYTIKMPANKTVTLEQLYKRLKLLHTLVNRINNLLQPNDENDQFFEEDDPPINVTHTIVKNGATYVNSPRKNNVTRSIFARTYVRSSTRNVPLAKLTKHLRIKCTELNFSVQLDELFNLTENKNGDFVNKRVDQVRESSVLYKVSPINRSSLRKAVLSRHLQTLNKEENVDPEVVPGENLFTEHESLQLTEVLNEINDITKVLSTPKSRRAIPSRDKTNLLKLNVNNPSTVSKRIWNIPVNVTSEDVLEDSMESASNVTQPSNVTSLQRITDLDLVESKLNCLKSQMETSL